MWWKDKLSETKSCFEWYVELRSNGLYFQTHTNNHYLWNFLCASFNFGLVTCVYTWVVVIDAWPRSSWMIRISAPFVRSVVAKLWRSVCAWIFFRIPALRPYSFTIVVMKNRVSLTFASVSSEADIFSSEKLCLIKSGVNLSVRVSRYSRIASRACFVR